jgi:muramoyltetrapeptide carboxypeptidase LdcA involved in peptidoglycan recycling
MKKIVFDKSRHKIAIVAPASACSEVEEKFQQSVTLLESQGFSVTYGEELISPWDLPYFAASKDIRLKHLKDALLNPDVGIIWPFRGGYGCTEIVFDCLDFQVTSPKILIGFSDITTLHFLTFQHYNLPSVHGPVVTSLVGPQSGMMPYIMSVLKGQDMIISLSKLSPLASSGKIEGKISGGNLTIACNMIGTKLNPDFDDKIIFLEDINEKGYHVHRNLVHLKNAGLFQRVRAVVFGDFTNSDEYLERSITSFCEQHIPHIPSYRADGIGHGSTNYPIVFGGEATIAKNRLTISSPFELV